MRPIVPLERQTESLLQAEQHWLAAQQGTRRKIENWTIAISRLAGTPGTEVGEELGRRLGWPVYDRQLIQQIASELGLHEKLLESVDEKQKNWLLERVETFAAAPRVSEAGFVRKLVETILSLGTHGHCIIVGRASWYVLPAASTLRVRLVGALPDRIERAEQTLHYTKKQAAQWVEETDSARQQFFKNHFFQDPADPSLYDLTLNTSRWNVGQCADIILQGLRDLKD